MASTWRLLWWSMLLRGCGGTVARASYPLLRPFPLAARALRLGRKRKRKRKSRGRGSGEWGSCRSQGLLIRCSSRRGKPPLPPRLSLCCLRRAAPPPHPATPLSPSGGVNAALALRWHRPPLRLSREKSRETADGILSPAFRHSQVAAAAGRWGFRSLVSFFNPVGT